jgi:hypothetical protein
MSERPPRSARRRLLASLGVAAAVSVVLILAMGPARTCDLTPPCPPGQFCTAVRIAGRCPVSGFAAGIAVIAGILAGAVVHARRR